MGLFQKPRNLPRYCWISSAAEQSNIYIYIYAREIERERERRSKQYMCEDLELGVSPLQVVFEAWQIFQPCGGLVV